MTIHIQSTRDVNLSTGIKCLVYGAAGVGKTALLSTAPNPIIFSAESGLLSLRRFSLPYIEIKTIAQLQEVYNWSAGAQEAKQFQTLCLDSISEIIEVLLEAEKHKTKDPRKAFGEIITQGIAIIRAFRDLPGKHIVLVAKEETANDDATGMMYHRPSFPGQKLGPAIPYFPDQVFQYCIFTDPQSKVRVRALRCHPDQNNVAKDRSGMLAEFEQPNLTEIFRKIGS